MFHMTFPHREMCDSAPCGICAEISEKGILQGEVVKILQMLCEQKKIKNNKRRGVLGLCTYACRDSIERKCDQLYRLPGYEKYAEWKYKYRKYSSDRDAIQFVGDGHFNRSLLQINEPRCFSTADIMWVQQERM